MYQNGEQVKGYYKKRLHKRKIKERHYNFFKNNETYWKQYHGSLNNYWMWKKRYCNMSLRTRFKDDRTIILCFIDEDDLNYKGADSPPLISWVSGLSHDLSCLDLSCVPCPFWGTLPLLI